MKCTMKMVHSGVLNPTYYPDRSSDELTLVFQDMDAAAGTARVEGNRGVETVEYRRAGALTGEQMHFVETTLAGNLNVTTVFAPPARGQPMPVVHSRHIAVAPANVAISQFAGECVAR